MIEGRSALDQIDRHTHRRGRGPVLEGTGGATGVRACRFFFLFLFLFLHICHTGVAGTSVAEGLFLRRHVRQAGRFFFLFLFLRVAEGLFLRRHVRQAGMDAAAFVLYPLPPQVSDDVFAPTPEQVEAFGAEVPCVCVRARVCVRAYACVCVCASLSHTLSV